MKRLINLFNQPIPIHLVIRYRLLVVLVFSMVVTLFGLYIDPLYDEIPDKEKRTYVSLMIALVVWGSLSIQIFFLPIIFKSDFKEGNWKIYKQLIADAFISVTTTLACLFYVYCLNLVPFNGTYFLKGILDVFCISVLPLWLGRMLLFNYSLRKNLKAAEQLQLALEKLRKRQPVLPDSDKITLLDNNNKELLHLSVSGLLLIRSADNYVDVFWTDSGKTRHTVLRNTIKQLEEQLKKHSVFFRCHRTCIINLDKILKISGNSLGCRIRLEGVEYEIPVSRGNRQELMALLAPVGVVA
ncbi:MAG: LytR/AlgR family response regulator transcription factor [Flavobacteriales bacterium]